MENEYQWTAIQKIYIKIKRGMDVFFSAILLIIGAIPMFIVALLVRRNSPGPAFFKQERLGLNGRVFKIIKFRSMVVNAEHSGAGVYSGKDDPRITSVGKVLRSTSIDEVPQLINVFKGEMSFIGPRPALTYHPWPIGEYTKHQKQMFDVRPGITGWAQVHGRKEVEWNERIELNIWYVKHISFVLDFRIFVLTIYKVLSNADNENSTETAAKGNTSSQESSAEKIN